MNDDLCATAKGCLRLASVRSLISFRLNFGLLGHFKRVIHLDPEVLHGTFQPIARRQ
ncbi:hypothetical protein OH764_35855 (plasmid) [Burkholderia sp. M6-3]